MNLIYHISEYRDVTFYNDHTKIMYNAVQKSMVRYNNLLRQMCKDTFDDVDISVLTHSSLVVLTLDVCVVWQFLRF